MKISYYGYATRHNPSQKHFLFDIRPFIKAFCNLTNNEFKNKFIHNGEHVFLLPYTENLYLFLITRTNEIIKKIKASDLSISEIYDLLNQGEHLGFASYIYFGGSFLGFASTIMAPKTNVFVTFLNSLLEEINIKEHCIVLHPLLKQLTHADAMTMQFMGRSVIQVTKENNFYEDIRGFFKGTAEEFEDVDSFEVVIKPKRQKNIKEAIKKVITNTPEDGLDKMTIRGREEIGDNLTDFYLIGKGHISDSIEKNKESTIANQIIEKIKANKTLAEKVQEHESNEEFEKIEPDSFSNLHDAESWAARISSL